MSSWQRMFRRAPKRYESRLTHEESPRECICGPAGGSGGGSGGSLHRLRQVLRGLPDGARDRARCRRGENPGRRACHADAGRVGGRRVDEVAQCLRRQRALHRRLPRGHQRPPVGDHRQDEGARGRAAALGRRHRGGQPLPPHGAGGAAACQHAAPVGNPAEDPGAGREAHGRRAVLYRLQRAAHAAHRAERDGYPRRARARLRRGRRHRPLLRRLSIPGSRPADLRADGASHLPALRPVGRLQGADLVPDLHQELRRAGAGGRTARRSISAISASSWPRTSTRSRRASSPISRSAAW